MIQLEEGFKAGEYSVSYRIKQGPFNGTYRVVNGKGEPFFMKIFDYEAVPDKMKRDGDILEIFLSRGIRHENVSSYVADGKVEIEGRDYPYVISDYFNGWLLSEVLATRTFTYEEAESLMEGILEGLLYLRSRDLNHNDLTPSNIILEEVAPERYVPRIIDMGHLCRNVSGVPPFPVEDLDLEYCAPEALSGFFGEEGGSFSAAAVLYALLTGNAPWACSQDKKAPFAVRKQTVREARKTPLDESVLLEKGVPQSVADTIVTVLQSKGEHRPRLEELYNILTGKAPAPKKTETAGEPPKPIGSDRKGNSDTPGVSVEIKKASGGGFDDVAGMEKLKAELLNRVIWVLKEREKAEKYRLSPPNGMILFGPPGCGKTYFAEKFAEETGFNFVMVNGSDVGSSYIHGTQSKIASLFKEAAGKAPVIICFDEFDSFVPSRSSRAAEHRPEEVNEFLGQLNNCAKKGIFVIGTTNRLDLIDPAVLRKGRMDLHVQIPAPDERTRELIFKLHLKGRPLSEDIDCAALAKMTDNYASADIAFIVNEAAMMAALADEEISQRHLENSVKSNRSSLAALEGAPRRKIGF